MSTRPLLAVLAGLAATLAFAVAERKPVIEPKGDSSFPLFRRALPVDPAEEAGEKTDDLLIIASPKADFDRAIPPEDVAAEAGTHWLELVDRGDLAESYQYVAAFVQKTFNEMRWTNVVMSQRKPLGPVLERHVAFVQHKTNMDGGPPGRYMVLHYLTRFANGERLEMITLYQDRGDKWHIAGYGLDDTKS